MRNKLLTKIRSGDLLRQHSGRTGHGIEPLPTIKTEPQSPRLAVAAVGLPGMCRLSGCQAPSSGANISMWAGQPLRHAPNRPMCAKYFLPSVQWRSNGVVLSLWLYLATVHSSGWSPSQKATRSPISNPSLMYVPGMARISSILM